MVGIFWACCAWYINMKILSLQPIIDAWNVFLASKFVDKILWSKEKTSVAVFFSVQFTSKEFTEWNMFLRLLPETGPPFQVVIRAMQRFSHLQGEGSTFLSYVETLSTGLVLGIKPMTSRFRSAVKCSRNWANPAMFRKGLRKLTKEQGFLSYCFASLSIASLTQGINSCERWDR